MRDWHNRLDAPLPRGPEHGHRRRGRAGRDPPAHARAGELDLRRGPGAGPFDAHEPAGLGSRPHRRLRGPLAGARYGGRPLLREGLAEIYDAFETPRATRGQLAFLRSREAREYLAEVRERALEVIAARGVGDGATLELIIRHERQHNETMLQTIALARLDGLALARSGRDQRAPDATTRAPPARRASTARGRRRLGAGADRDLGRGVHARRSRRRFRLRQRAPVPPSRSPGLSDRAYGGHQRRLAALSCSGTAMSAASGGQTRAGRSGRLTTSLVRGVGRPIVAPSGASRDRRRSTRSSR